MKSREKARVLLIAAAFVLVAGGVCARSEEDFGKTLSPYFLVKSDDPESDPLPLKSTSVRVDISGVIADVVVTQVYRNEGKRPLEAIYVFPASTRAAVYGMRMTIGERTITAEIRERRAARRLYEQARNAGKSASLLEQKRPNVFQMRVANILPSDTVRVELSYTELLVPTGGVYEFVYPTVVGPRYSNVPAAGVSPGERWIENPYLHQGEPPPYTFDITVNLAAGLPIRDVTCSSHKVDIEYRDPGLATIELDGSERYGGNRDFLLKYRLAGRRIQTGLLLFEGEEENFFLLMVQPPKRVSPVEIPPREYIFIVDVSGSMHGFPLDISKKLLKGLIGSLRPADRFNVLLFAGGSSVLSERSVAATPENIRRAVDLIERQRGGGGTELLPALKRALSLPGTEGYSRNVVIATDGYVTVEEEAFDLIRKSLGRANMFAFGIGSSVNRHIIEGMARVGMGEPFVVTRPEEAPVKAERFRRLIRSPVLTNIKLDFDGFRVYDVEPPGVPDVLADRPVIVFGKWRGSPRGCIRLEGLSGGGTFREEIDVAESLPLKTNSALRYLWARYRIGLLADYNRLRREDERVEEVTGLGLAYNLLTAYTSFVAIDSRVRLEDGKAVTIKQPLPLPRGVSDYAVAGEGFGARQACAAVAPAALKRGWAGADKKGIKEDGHEAKRDRVVSEPSSGPARSGSVAVELKEIMVTRGLREETVRRLIREQMAAISKCYWKRSQCRSQPKGEIALTLLIDSGGRVTRVRIGRREMIGKDLRKCLVESLKGIRFPVLQNRETGMIRLVFLVR
ncbi:MAG: AgmX/PglI C-terminal domain-containing protein [Deltaproteobacteria bacterium]|nr:AgmX/PglI C-terminal domain-containing protein [Deltaproteobacteria bacterium]